MLSVEEQMTDGRVRVLRARAVPAESHGPIRFAAGVVRPRGVVGEPGDDLLVIARAVGVMR